MYILGIVAKIPHNFGENISKQLAKKAMNAPFASFFQNISRGDHDPPILQENKKLPYWTLYYSLQLIWKFSRITYIGDWKFEGKITQNFWGEINTNYAKKMGIEYTICFQFSKKTSGRPRIPDPTEKR